MKLHQISIRLIGQKSIPLVKWSQVWELLPDKNKVCLFRLKFCFHRLLAHIQLNAEIPNIWSFRFFRFETVSTHYFSYMGALSRNRMNRQIQKWLNSICKCRLTAHNWQKWKSIFPTRPCHEIYREEAGGVQKYNYP